MPKYALYFCALLLLPRFTRGITMKEDIADSRHILALNEPFRAIFGILSIGD